MTPLLRRRIAAIDNHALVVAPTGQPPIALVHGDALDVLGKLPHASVDLIFADPPYDLSHGGTTCQAGERVSVDKGAWDSFESKTVYYDWTRRWVRMCQRVLRPTGTMWVSGTMHSIFACGWAMQTSAWNLLNMVTWSKPNASPNLGCRQFTHSAEHLIWGAPAVTTPLAHFFDYEGMKKWNDGTQMRDVWQIPAGVPAKEKEHGVHPNQKPIALLDRILAASAPAGAVVLDPFCGSGTTGVVARMRGCSFIGIDSDLKSVQLAQKRVVA